MRRLGICLPEMHRLRSNGAVPELCKASGLRSTGSRVDASAGICALEERSEGAEDAGSRAERHDGSVSSLSSAREPFSKIQLEIDQNCFASIPGSGAAELSWNCGSRCRTHDDELVG